MTFQLSQLPGYANISQTLFNRLKNKAMFEKTFHSVFTVLCTGRISKAEILMHNEMITY